MSLTVLSGRMRLRDTVRRQKWRLRPLKKLVLPLRKLNRGILSLYRAVRRRPAPRIEESTPAYLDSQRSGAVAVHPPELVSTFPHPFNHDVTQAADGDSSAPAYVFELHDVDFWTRYGGSVVTADNALLADISPEVWGIDNHPLFSSYRLPSARDLPGRTAILVTPEAPGNYYHWLIDLLPRALLIKTARHGFQEFDHILINGTGAAYEELSLRSIGLPMDRLLHIAGNNRFRIATAIIPSMDHLSKIIAPWKVRALRGLRDQLGNADAATRTSSDLKRIYISRKGAAVRRLLNEADLLPRLKAAGFAIVEPELLSWPQQVRLFSNAKIVLAPHGAALANIAFCPPTALVGEIATRVGYLDFYLQLAASAGLGHRFLEAQPRARPHPRSIRAFENEDMILDEGILADFLGSL